MDPQTEKRTCERILQLWEGLAGSTSKEKKEESKKVVLYMGQIQKKGETQRTKVGEG